MYTKMELYNLAIEAKRTLALTQNKEDATETWKEIARLYHLSGQAQERLSEIHEKQEEIRATWTDEQQKDWTFRDVRFDTLCREQFYIMTGGANALTISQDQIEQMATEKVEL